MRATLRLTRPSKLPPLTNLMKRASEHVPRHFNGFYILVVPHLNMKPFDLSVSRGTKNFSRQNMWWLGGTLARCPI